MSLTPWDEPSRLVRSLKEERRAPLLICQSDSKAWTLVGGDSPRILQRKDGPGNPFAPPRPVDPLLLPPEAIDGLIAGRQLSAAERPEAGRLDFAGEGGIAREVRQHQRSKFLPDEIVHLKRLEWLRRWIDSLSPDVHEALRWIHQCGFRHRRWALLRLYLRVPKGRDLFQDHPQIAWCLASSQLFRDRPVKQPLRSVRALAGQPRKAILRWLDLPGGNGTLNLLRRFPCESWNEVLAARLKGILRNPRRLRMLYALSEGEALEPAMEFLASPEQTPISLPMLRSILRNETVELPRGRRFATHDTYYETLAMAAILDAEREPDTPMARVGVLGSANELINLHDRLLVELNRRTAANKIAVEWSGRLPPPIPPTPWMKALETFDELAEEAREMEHCAAGYGNRIAAGDLYFYAVHHPGGRATLAIRKAPNPTTWSLHQIRGTKNQRVAESVFHDVERWLRAGQMQARGSSLLDDSGSVQGDLQEEPF